MYGEQFNKYFLYAIGEIILIVLGILIALQIDTWNTHKNEIDGLIKSFEQIEQSLEVDLSNINDVIRYHTAASEAAKNAKIDQNATTDHFRLHRKGSFSTSGA